MQTASIPAPSTTLEMRERGRRTHQTAPPTPAATPITIAPPSSHRSAAAPRVHIVRIEGQPGQPHAWPKSKCNSARCTSSQVDVTHGWPPNSSGRRPR